MKLCWLTDIHLNFIGAGHCRRFFKEVAAVDCDAIVISGDIAEAPSVEIFLSDMAEIVKRPIYYVLGNHDYYYNSIKEVRNEISHFAHVQKYLFWLHEMDPIKLKDGVFMLGVDGWADARYGDYQKSDVILNDSRFIEELAQNFALGREPLQHKMQELADIDAQRLAVLLNEVLQQSVHKIVLITHVPPFPDACWHAGHPSDDHWLPFFSSKAIGDLLLDFANQHPDIEILVLCGHTHAEFEYNPHENLTVKVGRAQYGEPEVQSVISL